MTSSLVGSEMCIRDRKCGMKSETDDPVADWLNVLRVLQPCRHRYNKAVSYTHLTLPTICSV
eukprot:6748210-Prorocentrum_lima.AAC.1